MRIVVEGRDLPGRTFEGYADVRVALQVGTGPVDPVPGDAASARWEAEVRVVDGDFRGPAVHGRRGKRYLYLTWGSPDGDDWRMFRRAKLVLDPAHAGAEVLTATVSLTDEKGAPRCARVRPPAIRWEAQASGARSL